MAKSDDKRSIKCSFCGKPQSLVNRLIAGNGSYICDECVRLCTSIIEEGYEPTLEGANGEAISFDELPKPMDIRKHLDDYIIGQEKAKIVLSVAVYNHYKRILHNHENDVELQKSNILLIGPTGSGKTLFAQTLAKMLDVPFAIADATTLTEAGYVGEDVENILLKLLQAADFDVERAETNILFICGGAFDGLDKIIEKRMDKKSMGFEAEIKSKKDQDLGALFANVQQHDLLQFGIIPELIGRLPVIASLNSLTREDLVRILTEPKNAMTKQYKALMEFDNVDLDFEPSALDAIADSALAMEIGARGLRSVMERTMTDIMYQVPSDDEIEKVVITADSVKQLSDPIVVRKKTKGRNIS